MVDLSVKVSPKSRDQRRELDKAAKSAGLRTGPWLLAIGLQAARLNPASVAPKFALAHDRVVGSQKQPKAIPVPSGGVSGHQPLIRSFDDAEPQDKP